MKLTTDGLRFGVFIGPYHKIGMNPTLALQRCLELIEHLDNLGFAEAWIGEHHSSGVEIIASPELMIAAASQRTKQIKLGTGVASLPYHHPFTLADRIVQLDHMTRGRMMLGVGPGQLLDDARMMGIDPSTQRDRMHESLEAVLRLIKGERVTKHTDWFTLEDAALQMRPYSDFDVAVTAAVSPSGPTLAGRLGTGLLSLAATDPVGVERLADHWDVLQTEASAHGHTITRDAWRLMGPMHIAETLEQATEDVAYGMRWISKYLSHISPTAVPSNPDIKEAVKAVNQSGRGVIGTPQMAIDQLSRLQEKSGGFGSYLFLGADYARFPATLRSYSLFAEEVMPHFNGTLDGLRDSYERVIASGTEAADVTAQSQAKARETYGLQTTGSV